MWTSTLDLDPKRILVTRLLGQFWPGAYFSSFSPLCVQNVPREALAGSNWVRVRNRLAGICGSDLHLVYANGDLRVAPAALSGRHPTYLGHEVVGEVIEIGDDVQHLRIGDRVALQYGANCLSTGANPFCHFCAEGNYNLCERGELPAPPPIGGGWSEELLLPEQQLFRVPDGLSDEQAVMLEPTAVAVHAVLRRLPQPDEHVLVIGAGTIGLLTVAVIRALVPQAKVSVIARYPFQIEQATLLGARIIYPQDGYQGVQQSTGAELYRGWLGNQMLLGGFDVIYDTIGRQKTLHDALRWARGGASVVLVGVDLHLMHIDLTPMWYQEINLLGSLSHGIENWPPGTSNRRSTFSITAELIASGQLRPELLITHRFALTDYQHALTTAAGKGQNRSIKVLFDYALIPASVVPNVRASARPRRPSFNTPLPPFEEEPEEANLPAVPMPQQSAWMGNPLPPVETPLPPEEEQQEADLPVMPISQQSTSTEPVEKWVPEDTAPVPVVRRSIQKRQESEPQPQNTPEQGIFFPEGPATPPIVPSASTTLNKEIEAMTEAIRLQEELEAANYTSKRPTRADELRPDTSANKGPSQEDENEQPTGEDLPYTADEIEASADVIINGPASIPETPVDVKESETWPDQAATIQADSIDGNEFEQPSEEPRPRPARRKRATKENPDASLQEETPNVSKRTRSRGRKKAEE